MPAVPCKQEVDMVHRSNRNVQGIRLGISGNTSQFRCEKIVTDTGFIPPLPCDLLPCCSPNIPARFRREIAWNRCLDIDDLLHIFSLHFENVCPYEIGNALSAMVKRRQLTQSEALQAEKSVGQIPVRLVTVDIRSSLQLALERDIYAYDAYFLQCAQEQLTVEVAV